MTLSESKMKNDNKIEFKGELKRDAKGHFVPGTARQGGRLKGTPNKSTLEIKQAIEQVFNDMGGAEALLKWAIENQTIFYTAIWAKLLPASLKVEATVTDFSQILEKARGRVANDAKDNPPAELAVGGRV
jgi:hypothetical protein